MDSIREGKGWDRELNNIYLFLRRQLDTILYHFTKIEFDISNKCI